MTELADTTTSPEVVATDQPIAGLGVDIIEIARMERAIWKSPHLPQRIFSEQEIAYSESKVNPAVHYALFFAAKEAVLKALGTGFNGMSFTDIEVEHDRFGRPYPLLRGHAKEVAEQQGILEMHLSLSYTHTVGVASAVAIKEQDRPRKEERIDPRSELAQQFKQMRSLLDDMDERLRGIERGDGVAIVASSGVVSPAIPGLFEVDDTEPLPLEFNE